MNNLVVQLLLKTGTFSTDLKKARGQVQQFQQGCNTAGKSVTAFGNAIGINVGALTKFGGAVGAAVVAGKTFKAMIDSTQTSSDAFQGVLYGCKSAVNEFAYAISTFDFTNFNDGLSGLITRAKEAYAAIDQLGDTLRGYSILEAKARAAIAHARKVSRDPTASQADKEAANKAARDALKEAKAGAQVAVDDYAHTLGSELRAAGAQVADEEAHGLTEKVLTVNARHGRDAAKKLAQDGFKAFTEEVDDLNRRWAGPTQTYSTNYGTFQYNNESYKQNPEYIRQLSEIADRHKEDIAMNAILVKQNDENLNKLTQQVIAAYGMNEQLDMMDSRLEGVENKVNGTTGATKKQEEAVKGSLESWTKVAQKAKSIRDSVEFGTEAWEEANEQLREAERNIDKIMMKMSKKNYADLINPIINQVAPVNTPNVTDTTNGGGLAGTQGKKSINELEHEAKKLEENLSNLKPGLDDKAIEDTNKRLAEIAQKIQAIKNMGLPNVSADKKAADSWDYLNSALANTTTILTNMMDTFQEGTKMTASSILRMVSTSLPALYSLATAVAALAGTEAVQKAVESSQHWIEAIAAVTALGSTVAAAIASAKSQKFAEGGIVGGSSYTGDRVTAQVNSGEMILNRAQQANLFKMINNGTGGGQVEFHISGTELVGVLDNQNRKNKLIR